MFRDRGELPNNIKNENDGMKMHFRMPFYEFYRNYDYYYIQYDEKFIAMELIAEFLFIAIIVAVYLFGYQISFEDPIAHVKKHFLIAQVVAIVISLIATGIVTFFIKSSKERLIKNLKIVAILSILAILIFIGIKLNLNKRYNENTFAEFYEQCEQPNIDGNSNRLSVGILGAKVTTYKQDYIEKSKNAYNNFSIKSMLYLTIYVFVVIFIFYLSYRVSTIERKKQRLSKDDAILYDDEENVKF